MANVPPCDICQAEPAVMMMSNLVDGQVMTIGANCAPEFYSQCLLQLTGAGQHAGARTKCEACKTLHAIATDGVTPIAGEVGQPENDHPAPADAAAAGDG